MSSTVKPIFLFADSQLLFWRAEDGKLALDRARDLILEDEPGRTVKAVYLGASNGDMPEFYDLFVAAMAEIGIRETRHVKAEPSAEEREALERADLILLSGGDPLVGWQALQGSGLDERIKARYYGGAVLVGISAGAMQLGLRAWDGEPDRPEPKGPSVETLRLVPFLIDVHDEPGWLGLQQQVQKAGDLARGYGIPSGGGALYHPDYSMEPLRQPVTEIEMRGEALRQSIVLPGSGGESEETAPRLLSESEVLEAARRELGAAPDEPVN